MSRSAARRPWSAAVLGAGLLLACTSAGSRPSESPHAATRPVYDYVALDGKRVSSDANLGKVTVIAVIATYDLGSQVVARELSSVRARSHRSLSVLAVVLEPPKNAPLAEAFATTLELPFPIAMADQATLEERGPFGPIKVVPTTIVLSPDGTEAWRHEGPILASEIERQIARARP